MPPYPVVIQGPIWWNLLLTLNERTMNTAFINSPRKRICWKTHFINNMVGCSSYQSRWPEVRILAGTNAQLSPTTNLGRNCQFNFLKGLWYVSTESENCDSTTFQFFPALRNKWVNWLRPGDVNDFEPPLSGVGLSGVGEGRVERGTYQRKGLILYLVSGVDSSNKLERKSVGPVQTRKRVPATTGSSPQTQIFGEIFAMEVAT